MAQAVASTSGRTALRSSAELGVCAAPRVQFARPTAQRQPAPQRLRAVTPVAALGSSGGKLINKYKTREQLEREYMKEWEDMTVLASQDANHRMTALTLLAAVPRIVYFFFVPSPIRFLVHLIGRSLQHAAWQLRKLAVLAGAKMDLATLKKRGSTEGYGRVRTALRRLHGKESLLSPLRLMLGR